MEGLENIDQQALTIHGALEDLCEYCRTEQELVEDLQKRNIVLDMSDYEGSFYEFLSILQTEILPNEEIFLSVDAIAGAFEEYGIVISIGQRSEKAVLSLFVKEINAPQVVKATSNGFNESVMNAAGF